MLSVQWHLASELMSMAFQFNLFTFIFPLVSMWIMWRYWHLMAIPNVEMDHCPGPYLAHHQQVLICSCHNAPTIICCHSYSRTGHFILRIFIRLPCVSFKAAALQWSLVEIEPELIILYSHWILFFPQSILNSSTSLYLVQ